MCKLYHGTKDYVWNFLLLLQLILFSVTKVVEVEIEFRHR